MAITLVSNAYVSKGESGTTSAIDITGATLLVAAKSWFSTEPTLSLSTSDALTFIRNENFFGVANQSSYYKAAPTISASLTGNLDTAGGQSLAAFAGTLTASVLDQSASANTTGSDTIQPGSLTPSENNCLLVSVLYFESGTVVSIGSGFTLLSSAVNESGSAIAYKVQTTAGAENPLWTCSASQSRINAHLLVFKAATGGGGGGNPWYAYAQQRQSLRDRWRQRGLIWTPAAA